MIDVEKLQTTSKRSRRRKKKNQKSPIVIAKCASIKPSLQFYTPLLSGNVNI